MDISYTRRIKCTNRTRLHKLRKFEFDKQRAFDFTKNNVFEIRRNPLPYLPFKENIMRKPTIYISIIPNNDSTRRILVSEVYS